MATTINTTQQGAADLAPFTINGFTGNYTSNPVLGSSAGAIEFQTQEFWVQSENVQGQSDYGAYFSDPTFSRIVSLENRITDSQAKIDYFIQYNETARLILISNETGTGDRAEMSLSNIGSFQINNLGPQAVHDDAFAFYIRNSDTPNSRKIGLYAPTTQVADYTLNLPDAQGTGALANDGSGNLSWIATDWISSIKTAAYTAADSEEIFADTETVGAWTLTLPATPTLGDRVKVIDAKDNWATDNLTVDPNGENINGAAGNLTANVSGGWFEMVYMDATEGWRVLNG